MFQTNDSDIQSTSINKELLHIDETSNCGSISSSDSNISTLSNETDINLKLIIPDSYIKCEVCSKYYKNKKSLRKHLKMHIKIKTKEFKCDICNRDFKYIETLNRHKKAHTNNYECTRCGKKFNYVRILLQQNYK